MDTAHLHRFKTSQRILSNSVAKSSTIILRFNVTVRKFNSNYSHLGTMGRWAQIQVLSSHKPHHDS